MAQQTKRSPGRPKAQTTQVKEATVAATPKKPVIKRKEAVNTHAEYEIIGKGGLVYMLPQKGITVYDAEKDTVREMRYCPNEPSIWSDEQGDKAVKQSVVFREGKLFVSKDKPNLRVFMESHPGNKKNGGGVFKEVNKKLDAKKELDKEFLMMEAVSKVRDLDINDLLPIALYFNVNIDTDTSEIRFNLLNIAKRKPADFLEAFDSPRVKARATIKQAGDYQIIRIKDDGCYWFDSNNLIVSVPVGQDPMNVMVRFCLTEKGASVLSSLEDKLQRLG